ncbi:MAG: hypothetical protein LIO54_08400 [Oscillospiraceae bacterium]|nr:hypothetical protein [Oscillospiraceae bacterium]
MMYNEFLELAGQDITYEQYTEVVEPMYIAVEQMTKQEFVKFMMPSIKALAKQNAAEKKAAEEAAQPVVFISDGSKTPNGCYYMGRYGKVVSREASIRTGKINVKVRELTAEEQRATGWDSYLNYSVDYYTFDERVNISWVA